MLNYLKNWLLAKGIIFIYKNYESFLYISNLFKKEKKRPTLTPKINNKVTTYPVTSEEIKLFSFKIKCLIFFGLIFFFKETPKNLV
jgi:hypothetical protein